MLIDQIARETGFTNDQIVEILRRAPHAYCVYRIPKRSGNGFRVIAHPSRTLKVLQRWLADRVLCDLPIHDSVYSYRLGKSVKDHAAVHINTNFLLRIDLTNFFPSITNKDVLSLLRLRKSSLKMPLSDDDLLTIARIVCKGKEITIGSPSSPVISNAVLYDFDVSATSVASAFGAIYTRYADDLYFSTNAPNVLSDLLGEIRKLFDQLSFPKVVINEEKVIFTSRKRRKVVTGLVITSDKKISLGREKKRYIRGLLYRFGEGGLGEKEISYLKGYLSFCKVSEPGFLLALGKKYGDDLFVKLFNEPTVRIKKIASQRKAKALPEK